jgi:hypothetical protein
MVLLVDRQICGIGELIAVQTLCLYTQAGGNFGISFIDDQEED